MEIATKNRLHGELAILGSALLQAFFPIITIISLRELPPLFIGAATAGFAVLFFAILVTYYQQWAELKQKNIWKNIFWASFINGVVYYVLIFWGLQFTTAGNASLVEMSEVLFSFIFL
jgi:drug/metabolite transporter (DMT)-like permease